MIGKLLVKSPNKKSIGIVLTISSFSTNWLRVELNGTLSFHKTDTILKITVQQNREKSQVQAKLKYI